MSASPQRDFSGTARFRVVRRLGVGGMGVVYEAFDRERDCRVALKTVRDLDGEDLLRLKNEFRALQALHHPNLVTMGELLEEEGRWFFTMELVDGVSFLDHVRHLAEDDPLAQATTEQHARRAKPAVAQSPASGAPTGIAAVPGAAVAPASPAEQAPSASAGPSVRAFEVTAPVGASSAGFHEERLRAALAQVARGLAAAHAAGMVHRDIKPSNILVTPGGRVVILDFGLVTGAAPGAQSTAGHAVGTVDYMAPEQAASRRVGPAADCYAVGVLLFEALTGRVPFQGAPLDVMLQKQRREAPRSRSVCPEAPPDLDELAADLLRFDPAGRPTAADILRRLGTQDEDGIRGPVSRTSITQTPPFVGRQDELASLLEAFDASRERQAVVVLVEGESGVGKTAVVRRFAESLEERRGVVLSGRCYEREAVPYKAVDGLVDALSRYMARLPDVDATALLPRSAGLLADVFPVLRRVKAVATAPRMATPGAIDPRELRSRLFASMRELVGRLADRQPLVLVIDDLQWSDADSLALLGEVLRPPEAPGVLVVATVRLGTGASPTEISRYLPADLRHLRLGPLPPLDARSLAEQLLERLAPSALDQAAVIAAEGGGHPLFIDELVRHAVLHGGAAGTLLLDDALRLRVQELTPEARRMLELVAVAGWPLAHEVVQRAASLDGEAYVRYLGELRVSNFVQGGGARGGNTVAPYHDRVREAVAGHLEEEARRRCHADLAVALEQSERVDPELLAVHWRGAGDHDRAAEHAVRAAAAAETAFAFDRAARLYRTALELRTVDHPTAQKLQVSLGHALAKAGRGAEAAAAYTTAAEGASATEALDLRMLATTQLISCGHLDEALASIHALVAQTKLRLARTPYGALASLLWRRLLVRLSGYRFRLRNTSQVTHEQLRNLDFSSAVATALGAIDTIRGVDVNARVLLEALRVGEPGRLVRALSVEAINLAMAGGRAQKRIGPLLETMATLTEMEARPESRVWAEGAHGLSTYYFGKFREASAHLAAAERLARDECVGLTWEQDTLRLFLLWSLTYRGEIAAVARLLPQLISEAEDRGDRYAATAFRLGIQTMAWLAGDAPQVVRQQVEEALARWSRAGALAHDWHGPNSATQVDLYEGRGAAAYARTTAGWRQLQRSLILRVQVVRIEAHQLRGRAALAAALEDREAAPRLLREAERDARRILRERMTWATPLGELLLAGVAAARGDQEAAVARCLVAAEGFAAADMALHAAVARRRQGELLGGDEGRELVAAADGFMTEQKIMKPRRWVRMLAPGFPE